MIIANLTLTPGLLRWLRSRHDDGAQELRARQRGPDVEVLRADGSELSEAEQAHVRGTAAAHGVDGGLR
jgi:hypothetical protein